MTHRGTLHWDEASLDVWDAVVIGAGPAGALAARESARAGLRVLLVDRGRFPRWKVCGACLNAHALSVLEATGLRDLVEESNAIPLKEFELSASGRMVRLALPEGRAVSRVRFDAALIDAATDAGAAFLSETQAVVDVPEEHGRRVRLEQHGREISVTARVVLVAGGLSPTSLPGSSGFRTRTATASRIGAGCVLSHVPTDYHEGTIFMAVGRGGYVGLVRVEDGTLNVAAAFDRTFLRRHETPGHAARAILAQAGLPSLCQLTESSWHGTPPLTRRTWPLAGERVFLLGDAAGYVEPFTGEGIAWALASGQAVTPLALQAARRWDPSLAVQWTRLHHRLIGRRQRVCQLLRPALRCPRLMRGTISLLSSLPSLARPVVTRLNAPSVLSEASPS